MAALLGAPTRRSLARIATAPSVARSNRGGASHRHASRPAHSRPARWSTSCVAQPSSSGLTAAPSVDFHLTCGPSKHRAVQRRHIHGDGDSIIASGSNNHVHLPPRMTLARASRLLRTPSLTSQDLCRHARHLAAFGESSLRLNAYAKLLSFEQIMEQALQSDERIRNGEARSMLEGVPVTVKANIAVGGYWEMPHACSAILARDGGDGDAANENHGEGGTPNDAVYESDIARRLLKDCGAVLIGITNLDEFGMGSLGTNNGVGSRSESGQQNNGRRGHCSPTYNPLPWMHRISSLVNPEQRHLVLEGGDDYWLERMQRSTEDNPHGIDDVDALAALLEEVQWWIDGNGKHDSSSDNGPSPLLSPGGSSSGAAAATAHGSSLLSIGTDTGGSLRLPAAWTSTVGFKPSYGTLSRYGVVSYASSLDTVGVIAGTAECAEIAWRCLRGEGNDDADGRANGWNGQLCRDSTARVYHNGARSHNGSSHRQLEKESTEDATKPLEGIRVGIPSAFSLQELPPSIAVAWSESASRLQNQGGATLVTVSESQVPSEWIKLALASYYVLACAEASSNLSRYDGVRYGIEADVDALIEGVDSLDSEAYRPLLEMNALEGQISATRAQGFGEEVQRRVLAGTSVLSSDRFHTHYEAAAVVRAKLSRSLENVFRSSLDCGGADESGKVDAMLVPTALSFPRALDPSLGYGMGGIDPTAAFANDVMTIPSSLGGLPSISVPFQTQMPTADCEDESGPIGMQVFSSRGSETLVLRVANTLQ